MYGMTTTDSNAHFQHLASIKGLPEIETGKNVRMQFYIAGKRSNGTSSFIIPLLMKIRKCILVIFLCISLFLFNNVTCWTCIKRIPFRAKIMYIAHNSVSMACDRNMCILVMVWSQYHSPSKDAVLLLPKCMLSFIVQCFFHTNYERE